MSMKYAVDVWGIVCERVATFTDVADFEAILRFARAQCEAGNSCVSPAEGGAIVDLETGEIIWSLSDDFDPIFQEVLEDGAHIVNDEIYYHVDDECGFDPYLGCYTDDC